MATLNPRLILAPSLQELFRDKDTGLPLAGGKIYFWRDQARNVTPKPVYSLTEIPGGYSYVALPNPLILSSIGTVVDDDGNDILPYYFPFVGTPDSTTGEVDLYYIQVLNSDDVPQFTRIAWPNFVEGNIVTDNVDNFIPDGQFWIHNDLPDPDMKVQDAVTYLSQGGWTFNRSESSASTDTIEFKRIDSYTENPTTSPRYRVRITNSVPDATDIVKDLRINFKDVNKFASDTQQYTYSFSAQSNFVSSTPVQLYIIKHFGTGGSPSPDEEILIDEFNILPSWAIYNNVFEFDDNVGKTIGTNNDDSVSLAIRFTRTSPFSVDITNGFLGFGSIDVLAFPAETVADMTTRSIAGWCDTPEYDGSDLYLPIVLTPQGLTYDDSSIGDIVIKASSDTNPPVAPRGLLYLDGSTYKVSDYSDDGIPYRRLKNKLTLTDSNLCRYGNGPDFVNASTATGSADNMILTTNLADAVTIATEGSVPTGFDFAEVAAGDADGYEVFAGTSTISSTGNHIIFYNLEVGACTASHAHTSGFTITQLRKGLDEAPGTYEVTQVDTTAATGMGGKYFTYGTPLTDYYVWYQVDGVGSEPSVPGSTGIKVNLHSTDTSTDVAKKTMLAINAFTVSYVKTKAASFLAGGGQYFTFDTPGPIQYYVWYTISGVGTDPAPVGRTGLNVDLVSTDTSAQVLQKTNAVINDQYFALPDWRGLFLRSTDLGSVNDSGPRFSSVGATVAGSYELDSNLEHYHGAHDYEGNPQEFVTYGLPNNSVASGSNFPMHHPSPYTLVSGGSESRPYNVSVLYFIKY